MSPSARPVALLVTLALLVGCSGGGEGDDGEKAEERTRRTPPTATERLDLASGWGPTGAELEKAAKLALELPVRRLAGQVIVAAWTGTQAPVGLVRRHDLGGVVAFTENLVSPAQARQVNRTLQRAVRRPWPLLIGIDQEGGQVSRLQGGATRFPTLMSVGAADDEQLTEQVHRAAGGELRHVGFNTDFAPVADVTIGAADRVVGARAVGDDPRLVTRHALAAAAGLAEGGVVPVLKHFPGHGSVTADSHLTLPLQTRRRSQLERIDWPPFREAVDAGLPAIMVGHLNVRALDRGVPSSLSRPVITGALRDRLGFEGLVVTDALNMGAVTRAYSSARAAVSALRAGADVLLMPTDPGAARRGIVEAVRSGRLDRARLRQAAARQIALLLHHRATAGDGRPPGTSQRLSQRLSAEALTSVAGPCEGDLAPSQPVPLGDSAAVANFRIAARNAGMALGEIDYVKPPPPVRPSPPAKKANKKTRRAYAERLQRYRKDFARWRRIEPRAVLRGTRVDLVGSGYPSSSSSYVVAVDAPHVLGRSGADVRIATYGDTLGAMTALVDFLQGEASAPGRLPVRVPRVRRGC